MTQHKWRFLSNPLGLRIDEETHEIIGRIPANQPTGKYLTMIEATDTTGGTDTTSLIDATSILIEVNHVKDRFIHRKFLTHLYVHLDNAKYISDQAYELMISAQEDLLVYRQLFQNFTNSKQQEGRLMQRIIISKMALGLRVSDLDG